MNKDKYNYITNNPNYNPPTLEEIQDNKKDKQLPCIISTIIYLLNYSCYDKYMSLRDKKECIICRKYCGKSQNECSENMLNMDFNNLSKTISTHLLLYNIVNE